MLPSLAKRNHGYYELVIQKGDLKLEADEEELIVCRPVSITSVSLCSPTVSSEAETAFW